jgi:hypothetical protein
MNAWHQYPCVNHLVEPHIKILLDAGSIYREFKGRCRTYLSLLNVTVPNDVGWSSI